MSDTQTQRWDERYSNEAYAYGETPNLYLKEQLQQFAPGKILFPAEGEGRNAVYAATLGWKVFAFDISAEGKKKALQLAQKHHVHIDYLVGPLHKENYAPETFDAIALIYAHFPAEIKADYLVSFDTLLRRGGVIMFEAFSKKHLDYVQLDERVGGPKEADVLYDQEELMAAFKHYDIIELSEKVITLQEGLYHNGAGSVIRFTGRKR